MAKQFAVQLGNHWRIENQQRYILDVTLKEYSNRTRKGSGPELFAVLRRLALTILQKEFSVRLPCMRIPDSPKES
jgi:predicted transposase YbfD/YdcC